MFGRRYNLFTFAGFPIRIDASWFIIAVFITWSLAAGVFPRFFPGLSTFAYWMMGIAGALGLFAAIVVHELSHAITARHFGLPMSGITLFVFGGVSEMTDEPPNAKAEFWVAVAGPIASVIIAAGCYGLYVAGKAGGVATSVVGVIAYLAWINAILVVFNVIPAFPLDGGRVLRAILWAWKKNIKWATKVASSVGSGFGIAMIVIGFLAVIRGAFIGGLWWVLIGLFLRSAARQSYQQLLVRQALEGEPIRRFMHNEVTAVSPDISVSTLVEEYVYRRHYKLYPVVDQEDLIGCVSTRDIQNVPREDWGNTTVRNILQPCTPENTVEPDENAANALTKMNREGRSRLLVAEGSHLAGILTLKDLLRFISVKSELDGHDAPPRALAS